MPEKLSNEQKHERIYCAFTHRRIAWFFVTLCAVEVFATWRGLDKLPVSRPSLFELSYYILLIVYAPMLMRVLRCFSERFAIGLCALVFVKAVVSWFAPTLLTPVIGLLERAFLALWALGLLMSLNMLVRAFRNPYVGPDYGDTARAKRGLIIMSAVVVVSLVIGMLMYFVPR